MHSWPVSTSNEGMARQAKHALAKGQGYKHKADSKSCEGSGVHAELHVCHCIPTQPSPQIVKQLLMPKAHPTYTGSETVACRNWQTCSVLFLPWDKHGKLDKVKTCFYCRGGFSYTSFVCCSTTWIVWDNTWIIYSGMQLCTTWVQSKVMDGYGQTCCSCVRKGCTMGTRWSCLLLW